MIILCNPSLSPFHDSSCMPLLHRSAYDTACKNHALHLNKDHNHPTQPSWAHAQQAPPSPSLQQRPQPHGNSDQAPLVFAAPSPQSRPRAPTETSGQCPLAGPHAPVVGRSEQVPAPVPVLALAGASTAPCPWRCAAASSATSQGRNPPCDGRTGTEHRAHA